MYRIDALDTATTHYTSIVKNSETINCPSHTHTAKVYPVTSLPHLVFHIILLPMSTCQVKTITVTVIKIN